MSAEFFICFQNVNWHIENSNKIKERILTLNTFKKREGDEFWLLGRESTTENSRWAYDVRLVFRSNQHILMEISAHPRSIETDLSLLFNWLRGLTEISIEDEDGVISSW